MYTTACPLLYRLSFSNNPFSQINYDTYYCPLIVSASIICFFIRRLIFSRSLFIVMSLQPQPDLDKSPQPKVSTADSQKTGSVGGPTCSYLFILLSVCWLVRECEGFQDKLSGGCGFWVMLYISIFLSLYLANVYGSCIDFL